MSMHERGIEQVSFNSDIQKNQTHLSLFPRIPCLFDNQNGLGPDPPFRSVMNGQ